MSRHFLTLIGTLLAGTLLSYALLAVANTKDSVGHHHSDKAHKHHTKPGDQYIPVEGGQAAFSAISEIVTRLEQNEDTDWNKVNIDQLHAHLRDMDNLMRKSVVHQSEDNQGHIEFDIRANDEAIESVRRMVSAHGQFMQESRGWDIDVLPHDDHILLSIQPDSQRALQKLRGLGFYGFMALGSHHRKHHYQMALGQIHHGH